MTPEEFKRYFEHNTGMFLLTIWCSQHGIKANEKRIIRIPEEYANLFKISFPANIKEKSFSLTAERNESNWLKRINWNRILFNIENKELILISERIEGDKTQLCDIGEIAIIIPVDKKSKLELLENQKRIYIKEFFVDRQEVFNSKPIKIVNFLKQEIDEYSENGELEIFKYNEKKKFTTYKDMINGNIQRTNVFRKVQYQGDEINSFIDSNLGNLTKPFDVNEINKELKEYGEHLESSSSLKKYAEQDYSYGEWYDKQIALDEERRNKANEQWLKNMY